MKVKILDKQILHNMISQLYSPMDGDKVLWFVSKNPDTQEVCIVSACGTVKETEDWVKEIYENQSKEIRRQKPASWKKPS